jgi:two-component system sensor histidine kinase KdpD
VRPWTPSHSPSGSLGATLLVEEGDDVAAVAARVARDRGTTYLLLGAPARRRGLGRLTDPLPMRLVRLLPEVDVRIVAERRPATDERTEE